MYLGDMYLSENDVYDVILNLLYIHTRQAEKYV